MYALRFRSSDGFIIFVVGVAVFTDMMLYGLIVPMLPYALVDRVGLAQEEVQRWNSILLGSFGAALMFGSLVVGWIGDRVSTRQTPFLLGLIALGLSTLAIALTRDVFVLLVARILQGLSSAVVATVGYAILFDVVGAEKIGRALGFVSMSQCFGLLIGPAVGGIIYEHGGYFKTFIPAFGLIAFEIGLRFLVVIRARKDGEVRARDEEEASNASLLTEGQTTKPCYGSSLESNTLQPSAEDDMMKISESDPSPTVHASSTYNTIAILFAQPRIFVALSALFIFNTILTAYDASIPVFINSAFSLTATHASFLFLIMVTPFLLSPVAGYITDRYGPKLPATTGLAILVIPVFLMQYITASTASPFLTLAILLAMIGFTSAMAFPALMAEVGLVVEDIEQQDPGVFGERGIVAFSFGVMNFAHAGGFLAGPVLAGWLTEIVGWKGLNFVMSVGGLLCCVGVGVFMVSFLSSLNPTPAFPSYTGPYQMGTTDVEIPAAELPSPSPTPDSSISTISFRIFYPSEPLPKPANNLPFLRILSYTTIPVVRNAQLLSAPTKTKRWPVMVFSHGLGGTKNAYSHLLGSLSSHGVVVIAPDHRDGSAPLSLIRDKSDSSPRPVEYKSISHRQSPEVEQARDHQLKIRLWEMGLVHEALLKLDRGEPLSNILAESSSQTSGQLTMFSSSLDVHTPGSISWAGHSFGAATVVQLAKSVFYRQKKPTSSSQQALFEPSTSSQIAHQITSSSPVCLLDLWCMPLLSKSTRWLNELPLPSYASNGLGGRNLIAILSEAFFKWENNLVQLKRAISEDPSLTVPSNTRHPAPYIFYPVSSAHLSQSDFGILFPWFTKKAFKAQDPARTLRLNTRALLEFMRRNGIEVADTSALDMETDTSDDHTPGSQAGQDPKILKRDGSVNGWIALELGRSKRSEEAGNEQTSERADPMEAVVQGEMKQ
ncbi:MAG: hypothetical protein Q9216_003352 [Gyalolechia sp. 2 TL-2023]